MPNVNLKMADKDMSVKRRVVCLKAGRGRSTGIRPLVGSSRDSKLRNGQKKQRKSALGFHLRNSNKLLFS